METYTLDEFCTGAWSYRKEYSSRDIGFDHALAVHQQDADFVQWFPCAGGTYPDFLIMLHEGNRGLQFEFYLYSVGAWHEGGAPLMVEPVMWIYGTTFDGVRESSGGQNFTADLRRLAAALEWVHEFACNRWPRYKEWYQAT